jgi:Mg2+/Co2+ transporter CorB
VTAQRTIYLINQSSKLQKAWRELSAQQKRMVIKECETIETEVEIESIIEEIAGGGQRRLF